MIILITNINKKLFIDYAQVSDIFAKFFGTFNANWH